MGMVSDSGADSGNGPGRNRKSARRLGGSGRARGHGANAAPCLPSLTHKCAKDDEQITVSTALESDRWKAARERVETCGTPDAGWWVIGYDRRGELRPWMRPAACHSRLHDGCRDADVEAIIGGLEAERKAAGEPALAMITGAVPACEHPDHLAYFWLHMGCLIRKWLRLIRSRLNLTGRYFWALEETKTGACHFHMVIRMLPPTTRTVTVYRKGKLWTREVATGKCLKVARAAWFECSGGWTLFWEIISNDPMYAAKYVERVSRLRTETKAVIVAGRKRVFGCSKGIPRTPKPESRWEIRRVRDGSLDYHLAMKELGLCSTAKNLP